MELTKEQAAQRIFILRESIKEMEAEVKGLIAENFANEEYGRSREGAFVVNVQRNSRFDAATAKANLSEEEYTSILSLLPDSKKAKDTLAPARYREAQKEFAPKISVTLPDEED